MIFAKTKSDLLLVVVNHKLNIFSLAAEEFSWAEFIFAKTKSDLPLAVVNHNVHIFSLAAEEVPVRATQFKCCPPIRGRWSDFYLDDEISKTHQGQPAPVQE